MRAVFPGGESDLHVVDIKISRAFGAEDKGKLLLTLPRRKRKGAARPLVLPAAHLRARIFALDAERERRTGAIETDERGNGIFRPFFRGKRP